MSRRTLQDAMPAAYATDAGGAPIPFGDFFQASAMERIDIIKAGVSAEDAKRLLAALDIGQASVLKALDLPVATMNRKAKQSAALRPDESERVLGIAKLIGQVRTMVAESGDPEGFDAVAWTSRWLAGPLPALGGRRPLDLMGTMEGQALVAQLLSQMQSGAYA